jgi:hypothetical protein
MRRPLQHTGEYFASRIGARLSRRRLLTGLMPIAASAEAFFIPSIRIDAMRRLICQP